MPAEKQIYFSGGKTIEIVGNTRLEGEVTVSGAKNAALPIMAAALLAPGKTVLHNIPRLRDVRTMLGIFHHLGVRGGFIDNHTLELDCRDINDVSAPYDLVKKMRASVLVLGALLGRKGHARVSIPGGCVIGPRPVDLHLRGLEGLNSRIEIEHGYINASSEELRGGEIYLAGRFGSSVGATTNTLLAAVAARGRTVITGAACEPEIIDLAGFLRKMGAKISGEGSHRIIIDGVETFQPAEYEIIPDRIEAGTYLIAGAVCGGEIFIRKGRFDHLDAVLATVGEAGVDVERRNDGLVVRGGGRLTPVDLTTLPYPGFPTDLQAQMTALLATVEGISLVTEKVYPERFMHIPELNRLGADITLEGSTAIIRGGVPLSGAPLMASDLRASAALVLAGLAARGTTTISRIYHLERGYERMPEKLTALGAQIKLSD